MPVVVVDGAGVVNVGPVTWNEMVELGIPVEDAGVV